MQTLISFTLTCKRLLTILLIGSSLTFAGTYQTHFSTVLHPRILSCKYMATFADEFFASTERAAFQVNGMSDRFQMFWVDAISNSALMVKLKAIGNYSNKNKIDSSVRGHAFAVVISTPIPFRVEWPSPQPTSLSLIDFAPNSLVQTETLTIFSVTGSAAIDDFRVVPFEQLFADQAFDLREIFVHMSPSCDIRDLVSGKPTSEVVSVQSRERTGSYPQPNYPTQGGIEL